MQDQHNALQNVHKFIFIFSFAFKFILWKMKRNGILNLEICETKLYIDCMHCAYDM